MRVIQPGPAREKRFISLNDKGFLQEKKTPIPRSLPRRVSMGIITSPTLASIGLAESLPDAIY